VSDFFDEKKPWSRWKHRLLHKYLAQFAGILGSTHKRVFYVDGFAGAGTYQRDKDSVPEDGSPLVAARISADTVVKGFRHRLHCINIEANKKRFVALQSATSSFDPSLITNWRGAFRDHLDAVLQAVGTDPALFFLDPFGHKGMEWDVVTRVARRSQTAVTEILQNFYITKIDRDGGWLANPNKTGIAFIKNLDALFGTDEWQTRWKAHANQEARSEALAELYMTRLCKEFKGIAASHAIRTITGHTKYLLLFGTSAQRGCRAMSEAVFKVSTDYDQERDAYEAAKTQAQAAKKANPNQLTLDLTVEPAPATPPSDPDLTIAQELAPAILGARPSSGSIRFGTLQDRLSVPLFGRGLEKHYRRACKLLIAQGKLETNKRAIDDSTTIRFL